MERVLEPAQAVTKRTAHLRKPLRPEEDEDDDREDQEMWRDEEAVEDLQSLTVGRPRPTSPDLAACGMSADWDEGYPDAFWCRIGSTPISYT